MASILWVIEKDWRTQDPISTPPFHFPFFDRSQIRCIVFLQFCPCLISTAALFLHIQNYFFCETFNEAQDMQECTENTWQCTFERLRLTNGTVVCLIGFVSLPFLSLHTSTRANSCKNEHCNRSKIRIGCELGWRLVCGLKMSENWSREKAGGQMNNEGRSQLTSVCRDSGAGELEDKTTAAGFALMLVGKVPL